MLRVHLANQSKTLTQPRLTAKRSELVTIESSMASRSFTFLVQTISGLVSEGFAT